MRLNAAYAAQGLGYFLNSIVIPSSPEPMPFGVCADQWQRDKLAPKIPAIEHLAGLNPDYCLGLDRKRHPVYKGPLRFMDILARGHNKSSEEAWISCWLAAYSKRIIHGYILAADRDQGRLIIQAANDLLQLNPWIPVTINKDTIVGAAGSVEVLPCDASSSMGLRGNFYIADEYVHWKRQKEWTAMVSGLRKVTPTVFCVLSNAGLLGSWQHEVFLEAKSDPKEWAVFHQHGTLASWLTPDGIAKDRRMFPPSEGKRLFDNQWIDPAEEHDYLRRTEVEACAKMGADMRLMYRLRRQQGVHNYVASIDYGPRRDRTVLCVMHMGPGDIIIVDRLEVWQGSPDSPVQIEKVEEWINEVQSSFRPVVYVIDPYQMESTIQKMQKRGLPVEAWSARAGQGNFQMAQLLRALIIDCRLVWYSGAGSIEVTDPRTGEVSIETTVDELVGLRTKKMPYGWRFDHENQKHDDRAVALAMGALRAVDYPYAPMTAIPGNVGRKVAVTDLDEDE